MTLKDLLKKHKWLFDVLTEILECITWEEEWLEQNKDDYIFVDGEYLVGAFLEKVKTPKTIKYNSGSVMFGCNSKTLTVDDGYNDLTERIEIKDKLDVFRILTYYYDENTMIYSEDVKDFILSKKECEKMQKFIDRLETL